MENLEGKKSSKSLVVGLLTGLGLIVIIAVVVILAMSGSLFGLSEKAAAAKAEKFINSELLGGNGNATVAIVGSEGDLYKLQITYQSQKIDSYMTKNGKLFFPSAYEMAAAATTNNATTGNSSAAPQSDKPSVELFVMSYCPYGTQIEKGILPAVQALGDKIDFKLKFVSYTMHGDKENQENLRQYCIDKEQGGKLFSYLTCFLKSGDAASCLKSTGVDETKLNSCLAAAAKAYKVTGTDFSVHQSDNEKYGVEGSPTLVINGTVVQSARDSASLLKTICSAFKTAPSECQKQLSTATPSAGFGEGTDSSASTASCN